MTVTHLMMHQQQFVVLGVVIVTRDAFALNPTPMMLTHWNDLNYWTFGIRSDDCPRHCVIPADDATPRLRASNESRA
jgi:hypothetical protein